MWRTWRTRDHQSWPRGGATSTLAATPHGASPPRTRLPIGSFTQHLLRCASRTEQHLFRLGLSLSCSMPLRLAGLWALLLGAFALQGVGAANLRRFKPRVSGECGKDRRCAAEEVFHAYLDWHNDTLTNYPCEQNRVNLAASHIRIARDSLPPAAPMAGSAVAAVCRIRRQRPGPRRRLAGARTQR